VLANFTVYMPDDHEGILSMERFRGMLSHVSCANSSMELSFNDNDAFTYAQRVWDWVNGADNHSFVMVSEQGQCGPDSDRIPFNVQSISYDAGKRTASLKGQAQDWKTAAHTYDLHVGHVPIPSKNGVSRRDYTKDWSVDFDHQFNGKVELSKGDFSVALDTGGSKTSGSFAMELTIKTKLLVPYDVTASLSPKGVSATAKTKLSVSGNLPGTDFGKSVTVLSIPLDGLEIPGGILDIGPNLDIDVGFAIGPLKGTAALTGGVTVSIPDSAVVSLDLLDPSNNQHSGWDPSVDVLPWNVSAQISGSVEVFAQPELNLKAEVLNHGYEIAIGMKLPYADAALAAVVSPQGACPSNPPPLHLYGVTFTVTYGAQLILAVSKVNDVGDPLFKVKLADYKRPFDPLCWDFGPVIGSSSSSSSASSTVVSTTTNPGAGNSTTAATTPTPYPSGANSTTVTPPQTTTTTNGTHYEAMRMRRARFEAYYDVTR
jgi:hypothetical protein